MDTLDLMPYAVLIGIILGATPALFDVSKSRLRSLRRKWRSRLGGNAVAGKITSSAGSSGCSDGRRGPALPVVSGKRLGEDNYPHRLLLKVTDDANGSRPV